jgi:membrane associated rhomboid family serine protease
MSLKQEQKKLIYALGVATAWVALLWGVELLEIFSGANYGNWGIIPRRVSGLLGILTAPFIHGDPFDHLLSNTLSLFPLVVVLFYFYRPIAWRVVGLSIILTGLWVWVAARNSSHIGVSGVIYALAFFLFFSGIFRKELVAMAVALVIVFFHGSMIWGTMPFFSPANVSWESHLLGAVAGVVIAYFLRKQGGPPRKKYSWEFEEVEAETEESGPWDYRHLTPPPEGFEHPN